jgi:chromosome segregation ATPase
MAELTERNQSLTNESQRLEALVDERAKEIHKLETELTNTREAAEKVRIQLAQALNKTETQSEQITAQQGRISSLEAYLDEANHAKVTAQQTAAVGEAKLEAAAREIGQQAQQIEQLRKDIADQKAYFEARLAEQIADARRRDQTFEVQIKDLRGDYQQRIDEVKAAAQAEIAALRKPAPKKTPKRTPKV